ncbi:MAG: M28 family peptidase [Gaiella sp.]
MEPALPATPRRRPRRGSPERPIDTRLVRAVALLLALPVVIVAATVAQPGPLPGPTLPAGFDGAAALTLSRELARAHPSRVPGTLEGGQAAAWFEQRLALYGLPVTRDEWTADVPGLGRTKLVNLQAVVRGTLDDAIVVMAHRDTRVGSAGANDNATGTAALIELARGYAAVGAGGAAQRRPLHTLLFLSTDGGAYGGIGAARFAARSPWRGRVSAGVSLDGLGGREPPRLELSGLGAHSPPAALVRTVESRGGDVLGRSLRRPGLLTQLVALGLPFAYGEQAPLLAAGIPAVRLTTSPEAGVAPGADEIEGLNATRFARLGVTAEETLGSLDASVELPETTAAALFLGDRAIRGWALALLLVVATVPFVAGALDLLGRARRRRIPLQGAWRALRRRAGLWLFGIAIVFVLALGGALPIGGKPPPPDEPPVDAWPLGAVIAAIAVGLLAWLRERALLLPRRRATEDEELAGFCVTFVALSGVAVATVVVNPYGLVFLLPSLYAWLWLPHLRRTRGGPADLLFGAGLVGPVLALVVLHEQLDLGARAPLYLLGLLTSGVISWPTALVLAAWAACAAQIAALAARRYAPLDASAR